MKDQDLYSTLDRVKLICSRFNVTITHDLRLETWVVCDMHVPTNLYWNYDSIYNMLFGNDSMFTLSEADMLYFRSQNGLLSSFINVMASLKSNTIEELNIKLDLYENGNY